LALPRGVWRFFLAIVLLFVAGCSGAALRAMQAVLANGSAPLERASQD